MYTDGLVERGDRRGRLFGLARLKRRLRDLEAAGAQETVDALFAAADAHADGAPQDDDMTIVAVRVL
jgi:serine phosphatase RsbU (regulator of sigma subunit)